MKKIIIGYCPTMEPYALKIKNKLPDVEIYNLGSAANALAYQKNKETDVTLIGRKAKEHEISDETKELILKPGFTLVSNYRGMIEENNLKQITVHTAIKKEVAENFYPNFPNWKFYDDNKAALLGGLSEAVLIDWTEWKDDFELLIPMNDTGKSPQFRTPIIYFNELDDNTIATIKNAVN